MECERKSVIFFWQSLDLGTVGMCGGAFEVIKSKLKCCKPSAGHFGLRKPLGPSLIKAFTVPHQLQGT